MDIGKELKKAREKKGMSQAEVARILEINRSTYLRYETGEVEVPLKRLFKLKYILDLDVNKMI